MKFIRTLFLAVALMCTLPSFAQTGHKISENDDIFITVGSNSPLYKDVYAEVIWGINYGHHQNNGFGYQIGFQYAPYVANVDDSFGIPLAVTFRTKSLSGRERIGSAANSAAVSFKDSYYWGGDYVANAVTGFLTGLMDRVEFFAGITPGYVAGPSSGVSKESYTGGGNYWYSEKWTEKPHSFSLSLDAGMNVNFSIWRFDLKVMPAFHYYVTDNYRYHVQRGLVGYGIQNSSDQNLRWFFTISGGLGFRF